MNPFFLPIDKNLFFLWFIISFLSIVKKNSKDFDIILLTTNKNLKEIYKQIESCEVKNIIITNFSQYKKNADDQIKAKMTKEASKKCFMFELSKIRNLFS